MNSENQDSQDGNPWIAPEKAYSADVPEQPALVAEPLTAADYLSWLVVILITLFIVVSTAMGQFGKREPRETTVSDLMQINLQAKVLLGQKVFQESLNAELAKGSAESTDGAGDSEDASVAEDSATESTLAKGDTAKSEAMADAQEDESSEPEALDAGTYEQRLCYAILLSELHGPQRALEYFETLDQKVADVGFEPSETQQSLRTTVETLISDYAQDDFSQESVSESDKTELKERLGFSGELLLIPVNSEDQPGRKWMESVARNKIYVAGSILLGGILFFMGGIVAACTILGAVFGGSSPARFVPENEVGGIYIQTFAIWLLGFFGVQLALPYVFEALQFEMDANLGIFLNVAVFFLSLLALAWPMIRGRSWSQVCHDIGWSSQSFLKNVGIGIATYAAWLPMMLIGVFSVFVLMLLFPMSTEVGEFDLPTTPGHPIQHLMASGDAVVWLGVFLAACVAAPIVEETMFRGVLYRHLRERGIHLHRFVGVAVAAVINGVIFAAIHPQGLLAIPLLTTLAVGFTLAREWRGSLVSSITMHALNNSLVTAMMLFLL